MKILTAVAEWKVKLYGSLYLVTLVPNLLRYQEKPLPLFGLREPERFLKLVFNSNF